MPLQKVAEDTPSYCFPNITVLSNGEVVLNGYSVSLVCFDADSAAINLLVTVNAGLENRGQDIVDCLDAVIGHLQASKRELSQKLEELNAPKRERTTDLRKRKRTDPQTPARKTPDKPDSRRVSGRASGTPRKRKGRRSP